MKVAKQTAQGFSPGLAMPQNRPEKAAELNGRSAKLCCYCSRGVVVLSAHGSFDASHKRSTPQIRSPFSGRSVGDV